jgi:hypothetical protein
VTSGPEGFHAVWNSDAESRQRLWSTLDGILALPGVARRSDHGSEYCAPYVFCADLPGDVDPFEALVVLGAGVALRDRASLSGAVIRRVDHVVLTSAEDASGKSQPNPEWTRVRLASGTTGYISTQPVRSPIDFRLTLRVEDGSDAWWLGFLLAGD